MRQIGSLKADMVKAIMVNQSLNKQLNVSTENIKHLTKINTQYQSSTNSHDQRAITQSLESELERERKVRIETEADKEEVLGQLKTVKEKSNALIDSLKQRQDQLEFETRKEKEQSQELANQIAALKKEAKNSLSVQEDLVRLIQSLQIELNQHTKTDDNNSSANTIQVRCQHEDDFNECAQCKSSFSVTRRKHRCKHCCKIFCAECTSKNVNSGPNSRPHKVCNSCHTLLDK
jgi:Rab GTPase-binding effector protein 1